MSMAIRGIREMMSEQEIRDKLKELIEYKITDFEDGIRNEAQIQILELVLGIPHNSRNKIMERFENEELPSTIGVGYRNEGIDGWEQRN
jgi:hydrogenase maturation factor HypE